MRYVRFVGNDEFEEYHSSDGDRSLDLLPGDVRGLSDEKVAQLEEDFGEHGIFEFDVDAPANGDAGGGGGDPLADLDDRTKLKRLKVAQLLEIASSVGVEKDTVEELGKPGKSRDNVIDAIAKEKDLDDVVAREPAATMIAETVS